MRIRFAGHMHEVFLSDDGTLDTVIEVDGHEVRFDGEHASSYRTRDGVMTDRGLRALAIEALQDGLVDGEEEGGES